MTSDEFDGGSSAQLGSGQSRTMMMGWFYKLRRSHENNSLTRHVTKAWSRRYFVMVRDKIKWYASADPYSGKSPNGFVNFQQILRIRVLNSESRLEDQFNRDEYGTFSIEIDSRARRLVIRTECRESARAWVAALRSRMEAWTDRTGIETLREIAKPDVHLAGDAQSESIREIDDALNKLTARESKSDEPDAGRARAQRSNSHAAIEGKTSEASAVVEKRRAGSARIKKGSSTKKVVVKKMVKKKSSNRDCEGGKVQQDEAGGLGTLQTDDSERKLTRKVLKKKILRKASSSNSRTGDGVKSTKSGTKRREKAVEIDVDSEENLDETEETKSMSESKSETRRLKKRVSSGRKESARKQTPKNNLAPETGVADQLLSRLEYDNSDSDLDDDELRESLGIKVATKTPRTSKKSKSSSSKNTKSGAIPKPMRKRENPGDQTAIPAKESREFLGGVQADENWLEEDWD